MALLASPPEGRAKRLSLLLVTTAILFFISTETTSAHITTLIPNSITAGGGFLELRILGSDFDLSDEERVLFNGTRVSAFLINDVELRADIPASLTVTPGVVQVTLEGFPESLDFTIHPDTGCSYSISPQQKSIDSHTSFIEFHVSAPDGCPWTARSNAEWLEFVRGRDGVGSGRFLVGVDQNDGPWRAGSVTVEGKQAWVYQNSNICPADFICVFFPSSCLEQDSPALTMSRSFRDDVLAESPRGRRYTRLYYQFSSEAVQMMVLNPMLILRSRDILERYRPVLESMIKGEQVTLTRGDIEEIDSFLNAFAQKGSPELRESLKGLCEDLRNPQIHTEFSITINEGSKREMPAQGSVESIKQTGMMIAPLGLFLLCFYAVRPRRRDPRTAVKRLISVAIVFSVASAQWSVVSSQSKRADSTSSMPALTAHSRIAGRYQKQPIAFELNRGQIDSQVKFVSRGQGYTMFLTPTEAVMSLRRQKVKGKRRKWELPQQAIDHRPLAADVLRMKIVGANPDPKITGIDELPGKTNYYISKEPARWRADIPAYTKAEYEGVYPGVDMVYYGKEGELEYDFYVAPGADPAQIRLGFDGAEGIEIDPKGDLVLRAGGGEVRQRKPLAYQDVNGARLEITSRYILLEDEASVRNPQSAIRNLLVGFEIGDYDRTRPLIIDPVLVYSTYFGGGGNEEGNSIAVDSQGSVYLTGFTDSIDYPLVHASQPNLGGGQQDAFVVKLDPSGTRAVYSTYLGGNAQDNATSIAVDSAGNAYISGFTDSTNFPMMNALQPAKVGAFNAFVTRLNASGALAYSTHLGGSSSDYASSIAVDPAGNIYVAGIATSPNFPVTNAIQSSHSGLVDMFAAKIDPSGNRLLYSTYLGGAGIEGASSIAVDSAGNLYLTGLTSSGDFRTVNPLQASHGGGLFDAFVAKLNTSGTQIIYSTYLGGGGEDRAFRIAVDSGGSAYVTGDTDSTNFPITNGAQQVNGGSSDAFAAKLNPSGNQLIYSTYLGGSGIDGGTALAVNSSGNAYVAGFTASTNFPTINPIQQSLGGGYDGFVAKLSSSGSMLEYSTYIGGSGIDSGFGIAADASGNAYVMGVSDSTNFPTATPFQSANGGGTADLFIAKIRTGPTITAAMIQGKKLFVSGGGFDDGAKIRLNGEQQKTANDEQSPATMLVAKKAGKKIERGQTVTLQVRNSEGSLSNELGFTRP